MVKEFVGFEARGIWQYPCNKSTLSKFIYPNKPIILA